MMPGLGGKLPTFPKTYNVHFLVIISTVGDMLFGFDISSMSAIVGTQQYLTYFGTRPAPSKAPSAPRWPLAPPSAVSLQDPSRNGSVGETPICSSLEEFGEMFRPGGRKPWQTKPAESHLDASADDIVRRDLMAYESGKAQVLHKNGTIGIADSDSGKKEEVW
ncbi:hypothetical protein B0A54_13238 [Friedmanniomyces endolithicus]|uniref:Major facilitator superfamily (MFS) profile domain-containing protein n=1 Tax=Friedmanniomyces endolithicus TaxID=329885 RepID=A0A4U0UKX6_9PEZI|nr:hypothetical protein LTS09_013584 [Friedmanniomyces endolithicus]TKA36304.1 hypothetical protein B0A54_13238 [Friedmanniomyces endolithicus]